MAAQRQFSTVSRILIVDDHPVVRRGLAQLLSQEKDLSVCGEAENAEQAIQMAVQLKPDIAIVDISLKHESGLELIKEMRVQAPSVSVIVLTIHGEDIYAERALRAGAKGYVTKDEPPEKLLLALRKTMQEGVYVSDRLAGRILSRFADGGKELGFAMDRLSDRELQIFEYIGQGMSTREIAEMLHRSVKTVEAHCANIKGKLKLKNATELLQHAIRWVQLPEQLS